MSNKAVLPLLLEMVHAREKIHSYTAAMNEETYIYSTLVQDAVAMNLEVVGEMANRSPLYYKENHTTIPRHQLAALRNIIAHGYASVDHARIWQIVSHDLPPVAQELQRLSQAENDQT